MNWRRHFIEAATLIIAAVICAVVSNAIASRERKVTLSPTRPAGSAQRAAPTLPAGSGQRAAGGPPPTATTSVDLPRQPENTTTRQPKNGTTRQPTARQPVTDNQQPTDRFPPHPDKPYVEIHGDDVAWLHSKGVLFLDARRTSVYEQGHIAGARPYSVWESDVDEKVNKLFAERGDPRDQALPIVIYCSGGDCEDSHMLAQKLWGIQFNNVYVYKDGFPDWEKRGGAIHKGSNP